MPRANVAEGVHMADDPDVNVSEPGPAGTAWPTRRGPVGRVRDGTRPEDGTMDVNPIEFQKYLKGVDYPTSAERLASTAEDNGAPREIVDELRGIGGEVSGPDQVMKKLG